MQVNDRVTVKTDGGPRRSGVVLAIESFSEGTCIWFRWKTTRWGSGFLTKQGIRTGSLLREKISS
ncbi:Dextransucrase DSRB [Raoultella ornithinolytica]|nr:Dextransucrase DSRB [Raoultella ornithinolytica]